VRYGGLGVGSGSFFVGFRGRARVGDSIKGSIYNRGEDLFTFFVYLRFAHPVHPIGDIPIAPLFFLRIHLVQKIFFLNLRFSSVRCVSRRHGRNERERWTTSSCLAPFLCVTLF